MDQVQFSGNGTYEIKVSGYIDEAQRYWFGDMTISTSLDDDGASVTTFSGKFYSNRHFKRLDILI